MLAMLTSVPEPDRMRRRSKSLASAAHERGGLGTEGGEGGGLGELNGNSILIGRETREDWRTEDDDDGEIGPRLFRLPASCLFLHSGGVFLSL